jgi:hypothetical protein
MVVVFLFTLGPWISLLMLRNTLNQGKSSSSGPIESDGEGKDSNPRVVSPTTVGKPAATLANGDLSTMPNYYRSASANAPLMLHCAGETASQFREDRRILALLSSHLPLGHEPQSEIGKEPAGMV